MARIESHPRRFGNLLASVRSHGTTEPVLAYLSRYTHRVAIARTLDYDPKILLLDEPFGALDSQTRETMQDELLRLWQAQRKTVVMVTHDVDEAVYLSERVFVMSRHPESEFIGVAQPYASAVEAQTGHHLEIIPTKSNLGLLALRAQGLAGTAAGGRYIWTPEPGRWWPRSACRPRSGAPAPGPAGRRPRKPGRRI